MFAIHCAWLAKTTLIPRPVDEKNWWGHIDLRGRRRRVWNRKLWFGLDATSAHEFVYAEDLFGTIVCEALLGRVGKGMFAGDASIKSGLDRKRLMWVWIELSYDEARAWSVFYGSVRLITVLTLFSIDIQIQCLYIELGKCIPRGTH